MTTGTARPRVLPAHTVQRALDAYTALQPAKRWARDHDACCDCGTTQRKHRSRGYCAYCLLGYIHALARTGGAYAVAGAPAWATRGRGMGERVPIREAALRLGVSPDTVRRRMKAGEMAAEKRPTPQGGQWFVEMPGDAPSLEAAAVEALGGDDVELVRLRAQAEGLEALVAELRSERDAWREQAARSDDAAGQLRVLLQQAQAFAQALPATTGRLDEEGGQPAASQGQAPPRDGREIQRRPWWKRWGG